MSRPSSPNKSVREVAAGCGRGLAQCPRHLPARELKTEMSTAASATDCEIYSWQCLNCGIEPHSLFGSTPKQSFSLTPGGQFQPRRRHSLYTHVYIQLKTQMIKSAGSVPKMISNSKHCAQCSLFSRLLLTVRVILWKDCKLFVVV